MIDLSYYKSYYIYPLRSVYFFFFFDSLMQRGEIKQRINERKKEILLPLVSVRARSRANVTRVCHELATITRVPI